MATSRQRPGFAISQRILLVFLFQINAVLLINARLWWYAKIYMGRKNHWVLLLARLWTQISNMIEFWQSGKKSRAIFDPANSGLSFLLSLMKVGRSGLFVGQKRWVHCNFPFFTKNLHEVSPVSCCLSQISCKNSTINFERDKRLGKKGRRALGLSLTKPTTNLSNRGGERGCDDTTINLTM